MDDVGDDSCLRNAISSLTAKAEVTNKEDGGSKKEAAVRPKAWARRSTSKGKKIANVASPVTGSDTRSQTPDSVTKKIASESRIKELEKRLLLSGSGKQPAESRQQRGKDVKAIVRSVSAGAIPKASLRRATVKSNATQRQAGKIATATTRTKTIAVGDDASQTKQTSIARSGIALWRQLAQEVHSDSIAWNTAKLLEWKSSRGLPPDTRVFAACGQACQVVKKILKAREGWACNDDGSMMWDIKFAFSRNFKRFNKLQVQQAVSHFEDTHALTTKVGLCNSLLSFFRSQQLALASFFPRCYDLMNIKQSEAFAEDFKVTKCACLLRRFVNSGAQVAAQGDRSSSQQGRYPKTAVAAALAVCKRRLLKEDDASDKQAPVITPQEWEFVQPWSLKRPGCRLKAPKRRRGTAAMQSPRASSAPASPRRGMAKSVSGTSTPRRGAETESDRDANDSASESESVKGKDVANADDASPDNPLRRCNEADSSLAAAASKVLQELLRKSPQCAIDGVENIWVLKPTCQNRGQGIELSADLNEVMKLSCKEQGGMQQFVVQKYIENPLIINNKKWDMRQWVLVTCWNPLVVWFYADCYVRFSFHDYDPRKIEDKFAHLTNNCISKKAKGYRACKDDTMWHSDDLREHLSAAGLRARALGDRIFEDPWIEHVQPEMKACVMRSLEATRDGIVWRKNCFELFGYDFMLSDDLNVWLIEANAGPDLSPSTAITRNLVKVMLKDLIDVVVDVEGFAAPVPEGQPSPSPRPRRPWNQRDASIGRWELLEPSRRRSRAAQKR